MNRGVAEADKGNSTEPTLAELKNILVVEWKRKEDEESLGAETMEGS